MRGFMAFLISVLMILLTLFVINNSRYRATFLEPSGGGVAP